MIQQKKDNLTKLYTLCTLTIIGSILAIFRAIFYESISSEFGNDEYFRGWVYGITSIGTIIGAIAMMNRKLIGLQIYTYSQGIYILTVLIAVFSNIYAIGVDISGMAIAIALVFLIPSLIFLRLYRSLPIRRHLIY